MNFGPLAAEICWRVWGTRIGPHSSGFLYILPHCELIFLIFPAACPRPSSSARAAAFGGRTFVTPIHERIIPLANPRSALELTTPYAMDDGARNTSLVRPACYYLPPKWGTLSKASVRPCVRLPVPCP